MSVSELGINSSSLAARMNRRDRLNYIQRPTPFVQSRGISDIFSTSAKKDSIQLTYQQQSLAPKEKPQFHGLAKTVRTTSRIVPTPSVERYQPSSTLARQFVDKPNLKTNKSFKPSASFVTSFAAITLVFMGIVISFMGWRTNKMVAAQVKSATTQQSNDDGVIQYDETKPNSASYSVAPDLPKYVRIPKLNVNAMIKRSTISNKGALKAPDNIHTVGWYDGSSKPGEAGAMLLAGHVAGPTQFGAFYDLKKLDVGDVIEVERGDGRLFKFQVASSEKQSADNVDMAKTLLSATPGKAGLNLITCTGAVSNMHYQDRLVIYAVQI